MIHLVSDNQVLAPSQLALAASICQESLQTVSDRSAFIERNSIDSRFALPDANWSHDGDNEFVSVYRRLAAAHPADVARLRGFSSVFSGYNLFEMSGAGGKSVAGLQFADDFESLVRNRLFETNQKFVDEWHILTRDVPRKFVFSPPWMLGEIGHLVNGVIVNNDTCTYQERINLIYQSGLADWIQARLEATGEVKICEVGGGYGALCYWFKEAFPGASYTIIDLPESLLFSQLYMSITRPDLFTTSGLEPARFGVRFLPNYMAELLAEPFDLIVNTLSMSEMSAHQVSRYIDLMSTTWLRNGGLFFEQNHDNRHLGLLFAQDLFQVRFPHRRQLHDGGKCCFRNGYPNIWSLHPIVLSERAAQDRSVMLLEDLGDFNLVREGAHYWGLSKQLGPTDPAKLERCDYPPLIYRGATAEVVRAKIRTAHPTS